MRQTGGPGRAIGQAAQTRAHLTGQSGRLAAEERPNVALLCYYRRVADPLIGKQVDNGEYVIVDRIGSGGMGSVYKAEQPSMNRMVAIKVLHSRFATRDDLVARFRREARAMSQLAHPNT